MWEWIGLPVNILARACRLELFSRDRKLDK
jgi:hypothetical protein